MKAITLNPDVKAVTTLEGLSFEIEARKSVISEMLAQNMDIETDAFCKYQKELVEYQAKFETAKRQFQAAYVDTIPGAQRWSLEYSTGTLTVEVLQ